MNNDDLSEFVKEALLQVLNGAKIAQTSAKQDGLGDVNPSLQDLYYSPASSDIRFTRHDGGYVQFMEFDIAVTAEHSTSADGKVGVRVLGIGSAIEGETKTLSSSVSRIKFQVPIKLPLQADH